MRPQGALSFCGYVPTENATNDSSVFQNECFIDAIRAMPHVLFTFLIIPLLIALHRGTHYHARTWVHFPWHQLRWVLSFVLVFVHMLAIAEGFLSDDLFSGSHVHLYLPSMISLLSTVVAITFYHNIEMWNSPKFLQLLLVFYWLMSLGSEVLKAICLGLKQLSYIYIRVPINWVVVLLYACLLVLELDVRRQMKLFFCYKKPNIPAPPEDLIHIHYIHDKVSLLSRLTFFWIQRIIHRGFRGYIDWRDLGELPQGDQVSYQMKQVQEKDGLNQIFNKGLSLGVIYGKLLQPSYVSLAVGIVTSLGADVIACFSPVVLGYIILYLEHLSSSHASAENVTLPVVAQYIFVKDYFSNGYILLIILSTMLAVCVFLKESSKHIMARIGLRLDTVIKTIIFKKFFQIRLRRIPGFIDAQQTASELVNTDWSVLVMGMFTLFRYYIKITICYALIYCYCGPVSHVLIMIYITGSLLLLYNHYKKEQRDMLTGNLQYIRQVRLQGNDSLQAVSSIFVSQQEEEKAYLRKPTIFSSLYGCVGDATVIVFSLILFPSMVRLQGAVPPLSSVIVVLLLLHCIRASMPDVVSFVDLLSSRKRLRQICELLCVEPVLGRTVKNTESSEPSEASTTPVTFSLEFKSGDNVNGEQNPFVEEQIGSSGVTSKGTDPGAIEMTEVTPMLGIIKEEETIEVSDTDKHVTFSTEFEKAMDLHSTPSHSTEGSSLDRDLSHHYSSGTFSHFSDMDESLHAGTTRGIGLAVEVQSASCTDNTVSLKDICIKIDDGKLTIITGPKLAGKSLLLDGLLLGNTETISGVVSWKPNTTVSYAGYPAWIMQASVMENILFGEAYEKHRYHKVIKACALMSDLDSFPDRDLTILRSYQLTDGQRNRITLARALYSHSDIVLLNEPLSCMNVNKGSEIFEEGILKFLLRRKRTVILATKQIQFFPFAHMIYRMEHGKVTHSGSLKEIKQADPDLFNRWQSIAKLVRRESYTNLSMCMNRNLAGHHRERHDSGSKSLGSQDTTKMGISPSKSYSQTSRIYDVNERSHDGHMTHSESGSSKPLYSTQSSREIQDDLLDPNEKGPIHLQGAFTYRTPKDYLGYAKITYLPGILWKLLMKSSIFLLCLAMVLPLVILTVVTYIFILLWDFHEGTQISSNVTTLQRKDVIAEIAAHSYQYVWLYLALLTIVLIVCLKFAVSFSGLRTAHTAHRDLTELLLQSNISSLSTSKARHFLDQIHETKGIRKLQNLCECLSTWLHTVVLLLCTVVIIAVASPYLIIPGLVLLVPEVLLQMGYYHTARQLFTLHIFAQTNLRTNVYDFLKGLSVIRAYRQEDHILNILYERIDAHTNVLLWKLAVTSWFNIRMHLLTVLLFTFCGFGLLHEGQHSLTIFVVAAFLFIFVLYYIRDIQIASLHNIVSECLSQGSILKMPEVIEYSPQHSDEECIASDWPQAGCISYTDVSLTLDPNKKPIVTGATFTLASGDKLGICGAAGSGKSTLIMALSRIPAISHGTVLVDGVDIREIPSNVICSRITIIPCDATILHQTVRFNLCPYESKSDTELWKILETVELKNIVETFPGQLDQVISEEYLNSTEKQQLLLAYALLRGSSIVVLDDVIRPENTTVRHVLDKLFHEEWKHTTVVIVTNQADFLLTVTETLIMESGCIVEQGKPAALIKKKSPFFPPVNLP